MHSKRPRTVAGFGLVELMVTVSIMVLVTSIILTKQSAFSGAVVLRNQAYEVAFTLRQAQLLAVSGGDPAIRQYGVYFNPSTPRAFILFQDTNDNGWYNSGEAVGPVERLDDRFEVRGLFTGGTTVSGDMVVVFERPNFDARFCTAAGTCSSAARAFIDIARRNVTTNGTGDVRRVEVTETGQISVVTY